MKQQEHDHDRDAAWHRFHEANSGTWFRVLRYWFLMPPVLVMVWYVAYWLVPGSSILGVIVFIWLCLASLAALIFGVAVTMNRIDAEDDD